MEFHDFIKRTSEVFKTLKRAADDFFRKPKIYYSYSYQELLNRDVLDEISINIENKRIELEENSIDNILIEHLIELKPKIDELKCNLNSIEEDLIDFHTEIQVTERIVSSIQTPESNISSPLEDILPLVDETKKRVNDRCAYISLITHVRPALNTLPWKSSEISTTDLIELSSDLYSTKRKSSIDFHNKVKMASSARKMKSKLPFSLDEKKTSNNIRMTNERRCALISSKTNVRPSLKTLAWKSLEEKVHSSLESTHLESCDLITF